MSDPLATTRSTVRRLLARWRSRSVVQDESPLTADVDPRSLPADAPIHFYCNLCGTRNVVPLTALQRETPSCSGCGSTVRFRAMAHLVTREVVGTTALLRDLPVRHDLCGVGLSDAAAYALPLAERFSYENTWYHQEPRLDIAAVDASRFGRYDFVIASDVFEHVTPPVARAFVNVRQMLKPGGVFIFTVPFSLEPDTLEHFPDLHDWSLAERNGRWELDNRTVDGRTQRHTDLVFHGGPGSTLEMRLFSQAALLREFAQAGFVDVRIAADPYLPFGIHWPEPWSVPMIARAG